MLEAHCLVLGVLAQFFMAKENHAYRNLFQPDDAANDPRCLHRAQGGESGDSKKEFSLLALKRFNSYIFIAYVPEKWGEKLKKNKLP